MGLPMATPKTNARSSRPHAPTLCTGAHGAPPFSMFGLLLQLVIVMIAIMKTTATARATLRLQKPHEIVLDQALG